MCVDNYSAFFIVPLKLSSLPTVYRVVVPKLLEILMCNVIQFSGSINLFISRHVSVLPTWYPFKRPCIGYLLASTPLPPRESVYVEILGSHATSGMGLSQDAH